MTEEERINNLLDKRVFAICPVVFYEKHVGSMGLGEFLSTLSDERSDEELLAEMDEIELDEYLSTLSDKRIAEELLAERDKCSTGKLLRKMGLWARNFETRTGLVVRVYSFREFYGGAFWAGLDFEQDQVFQLSLGGSFEPQWGLGKNEGWKDFVARCVVDKGELFVHEILKLTRQKTSWEQHHWKGYLERKEWFLKCLQARLGDGGETGNVDGNNLIEQAIKDPKRVGFHVSWGNRDLKCVPNLERLAVLMMTVEDSKKAFTKKQGASKGTKKERQDRIEVEPSWRAHIKELALRLTPDAKRVCDNIEASLNSRGFSGKFFASSVQLYT